MKPSDMLHQMCHSLLAAADVKALCKVRGLASDAIKSPGILETLFLSSQGVSDVLTSLDPSEVTLLHLLRNSHAPVDISFFARAYDNKGSYGTFNQRFQGTFAKVKQRLIRGGVLLWAEGRQNFSAQQSKLERSRFTLPLEFHCHLPPLIASPREFDGSGNWKPNVARDKLLADLRRTRKKADNQVFHVEADELQLNGKRFEAAQLIELQQSGWAQAVQTGKKKTDFKDTDSKQPAAAALCILSELADGCWADAEQLADPLRIFCGKKVDGAVICEAGWEWGLLAKRKADGKLWYRPAPKQPHIAPHQYLSPREQDDCVSVDLTEIPHDSLEQIVAISDQRLSPGGNGSLLLTPNFVKLGRADDNLLATEAVQWLVEHTQPFAEAYVALSERRGKTILHEGVTIARVSDLSLKVAIEKALGRNVVSLKNDFIAFPLGFLPDVQRVVKKSGHVVKEVAAK
ncbi:MAG TPA: hypothetical protein QF564_13950 [Pirellulaceae bacterium]|nr:hypothetical protein [Pirellulaceae bacterium]